MSKPAFDVMSFIFPRKKKDGRERYADFNRRMLAASIDSMIVVLAIAPAIDVIFNFFYAPIKVDFLALQAQTQAHPQMAGTIFFHTLHQSGYLARWISYRLAQVGVLSAVVGVCWRNWSATPGKMLLRMKIVDATTEGPISDLQIILRLIGYGISTLCLCIGFFWMGIDRRRQGWHDKLAHTVVLVVPRKIKEAPLPPEETQVEETSADVQQEESAPPSASEGTKPDSAIAVPSGSPEPEAGE